MAQEPKQSKRLTMVELAKLRMIEGESLGVTQVELSTSLVIRESCAPPRS